MRKNVIQRRAKRIKYEHINVKVAASEMDFLEEEEICRSFK